MPAIPPVSSRTRPRAPSRVFPSTRCTPAGLCDVREAVADYYNRRGIPTAADNIIMTQGSLFALATALSAVLDAGDEVLVPDPGFPNYNMTIHMLKGHAVPYKLDPATNWQPDMRDLAERVSPRTKMVILCSPSNPTGAVLSRGNMQKMVDFARERGLYVLSDEIYSDICFDVPTGESATSVLECDHDPLGTFVVSGASKSYAMTGFRVGWIRWDASLHSVGTMVQEAFYSCGVPFCQTAVAAVLNGDQGVVHDMTRQYQKRRDLVCSILDAHGCLTHVPQGAFYVMVDVESALRPGESSTEFTYRLLEDRHVAVAPGDTFGAGARNYVRLSLASSEEALTKGVTALCEYIGQR